MPARLERCFELDPLPSALMSGRMVHRHCLRERWHSGWHESKTPDGETVHQWLWVDQMLQQTPEAAPDNTMEVV